MKRSEVLEVIEDMLYDFEFKEIGYTKSSKILLDKLEEMGMLPPTIFKHHQVGPVFYQNEPVNEWESENE